MDSNMKHCMEPWITTEQLLHKPFHCTITSYKVKVNISMCLIKDYAMKKYEKCGV
jgi:hypothetical protein